MVLDDPSALAVTLNNAACLLREKKRLQESLDCLNRAFEIESTCGFVPNSQSGGAWREVLKTNKSLSDTLINTSAVLSELGRHSDSIGCIKRVINIVRESISRIPQESSQQDASTEELKVISHDIYQVLAAAYYNLGVEQEFLSMYSQSLASFQKGLDVAECYVGVGSSIALALREAAGMRQIDTSLKAPILPKKSVNTSIFPQISTKEEKSMEFSLRPPYSVQMNPSQIVECLSSAPEPSPDSASSSIEAHDASDSPRITPRPVEPVEPKKAKSVYRTQVTKISRVDRATHTTVNTTIKTATAPI
jgi:tetratricopeptide (TPR) repeat protein